MDNTETKRKRGRVKVYKVQLHPCMCYVADADKKRLRAYEKKLKKNHEIILRY